MNAEDGSRTRAGAAAVAETQHAGRPSVARASRAVDTVQPALERFLEVSGFRQRGLVITDLDGTAVHEVAGRVTIPQRVELALAQLARDGQPLALNTLRFPLSVLRTFGREWYRVTSAPLPAVTLNGSLIGHIVETHDGELGFEELLCYPLTAEEIDAALAPVQALLSRGVREVLVFYYPRDWRMGELIWTPVPENVLHVKKKYSSASSVTAVELGKLRAQLAHEELCMICVLLDAPRDRLMAYQHSSESSFFTHAHVDKLFGAQRIAEHLGKELSASIGAGDTMMDRFLAGTGCSVIVGKHDLPFRGVHETLHVASSLELGELLFRVCELQASR